jgi:co-chaperonin GroES (HSP10)
MGSVQAGINRVAVRMPGWLNDTVKHKSLELQFDPLYNPTMHQVTSGLIESVPYKVDLDFEKFNADMEGVCTHVHFDFKALNEEEYVQDGEDRIYFVPIEWIYAATYELPKPDAFHDSFLIAHDTNTRNGQERYVYAYANTGVVLCSAFYGFGFEEMEVDGQMVACKPNSLGIITEISPSADPRVARVEVIGSPWETDHVQPMKQGDLVFRDAHTNYEYDIHGVKLFVVKSENIAGVITTEEFHALVIDEERETFGESAVKTVEDAMLLQEELQANAGKTRVFLNERGNR